MLVGNSCGWVISSVICYACPLRFHFNRIIKNFKVGFESRIGTLEVGCSGCLGVCMKWITHVTRHISSKLNLIFLTVLVHEGRYVLPIQIFGQFWKVYLDLKNIEVIRKSLTFKRRKPSRWGAPFVQGHRADVAGAWAPCPEELSLGQNYKKKGPRQRDSPQTRRLSATFMKG